MNTFRIPLPSEFDHSKYKRHSVDSEVFYGLPSEVKFCRRCVVSNQRPNSAIEYQHHPNSKKKTINFENGICDACRFAEKKRDQIDWQDREKQLIDLCNKYRKHDGSYDCIVPGSGGKDSFFTSHILKTRYGMHPLTVTWAPHIYTDWGWRNLQSWIAAGHDNYLMTPNTKIHRLLTRLSTELLLHPFQVFMMGQKALAPKMSLLFNIPLIFYGENQAEDGNPISDADSAKQDTSFFTAVDNSQLMIGGVSVAELIDEFGVELNDLNPYLPADSDQIQSRGVSVHYLGYYLKWHPQSCYYYAVEHGGFEAAPERSPGTYSKYSSIDDRIDDLHYLTTGIKFGIGRATYDAAQEVRSRDITREEGVALVKRFDHEFPERFIDELLKYLSIPETEFPRASKNFASPIVDRNYFNFLLDKFRSPHLWYFEDGEWNLRHAVWHDAH